MEVWKYIYLLFILCTSGWSVTTVWAVFFCLAWAVSPELLQSAVTTEEAEQGLLYVTTDPQCALWSQPNVCVFWDTKLLVFLSNTIGNLLFGFCHDLRKRVFKVVWATAFQRCLYYKKGKLLSQKFWFALFNKPNFYFCVPLKPFECMSSQQSVYQESTELIVNSRKN